MISQTVSLILLLQIGSSFQENAPTKPIPATIPSIFALMVNRLELAVDVATYKYKVCQDVQNVTREQEVIDSKTAEGEKLGVPKEDVKVFFEGQIEANKFIQYSMLTIEGVKGRPMRDIVTIRGAIDEFDGQILLILKAVVAQFKSQNADKEVCLKEIGRFADEAIKTAKDVPPYFKAAFMRSANIFISICLASPICKPEN